MVDFFYFILKHPRQQDMKKSQLLVQLPLLSDPPPRGDEHTVAAAGGAFIKLWEMSNLGADSGKTTEGEASPGF